MPPRTLARIRGIFRKASVLTPSSRARALSTCSLNSWSSTALRKSKVPHEITQLLEGWFPQALRLAVRLIGLQVAEVTDQLQRRSPHHLLDFGAGFLHGLDSLVALRLEHTG